LIVEQAMGRHAVALLATLNTECANTDNLMAASAEAFREHPDYQIITSFPGLGDSTGARILAEIGDDPYRARTHERNELSSKLSSDA
jgi:hypothetical protein